MSGNIGLNGDYYPCSTNISGVVLDDNKKRCQHCGAVLPATNEYFYKNKSRSDGLSHYCKECSRTSKKKFLAEHPEYEKDYYQSNLEKAKSRCKEYRKNNKERISEMHKEYYYNRGGKELQRIKYNERKQNGNR